MKRKEKAYRKRCFFNQNIRRRHLCFLPVILLFFLFAVNHAVAAIWPSSGAWPVWGTQPGAITPVPWPANVSWQTYTALGSPLADPAVADPSNGGTSPQNYVSVTSNCPDRTLPSVYWAYDSANQMIFFRFRLAAIPCTYATGPSAGSASTTDAWRSAQWSVLIDIDGDGYREFAMQLDGSTGGPGNPVDRLSIIYSATQSNSLDYENEPSTIHLVNQFPAAYVNTSGGTILNFHNSNSPDTSWPNGSAEILWDYGMTRCVNGSTPGCIEYITDYQIPLAMLNASAVGGPVVDENTPMSFLFTTANSLQNPFQKDVVTAGDAVYIGDPNEPGPFGDTITLGDGPVPQATVVSVSASGCGPVSLSAEVNDALIISGGNAVTSVTAVEFYYYEDTNGNGIEDDSNTWTFIGNGSTTNNPVGTWTASWNSTSIPQGAYLIGAKATNGQGNITWSWVDPADIGLIGPTPPNYANPPDPGQTYALFNNICGGPPPYAVKTSDAAAPLSPGAPVTFTITIYNTGSSPLNVSSVTDSLPAGFIYQSTGAGTLGAPSASPTPGDTGVITWTFPPASVPAGSNRTLIFTCSASTTAGTYSNSASAQSSVGTLDTEPTEVSVGAAQLTITKSASGASVNPGDTLVYTIGYANTSPVNITGVTISEPLPDGVTYASNTGGGIYNPGTRTVSWVIGNLAAGESGTVTVTVTVDDPFPAGAAIPMVNTATLTSNESVPTSASSSVFVNTPRPILVVQKSAASAITGENTDVTFTISYANTGTAAATSLTLTDPVPAGMSFVSASGGGTYSAGTVTWNLPDLAPNTTGSVTVTLHVPTGYTGANPATNTVTLAAAGVSPVTDSFRLGVTQANNICTDNYFTDTWVNVGTAGSQRIANTTVPAGAGTNVAVTTELNQVYKEALRFYTDPPTANAVNFNGNLTTSIYIDRAPGNGITIQSYVFDYDPANGNTIQLGTNTQSFLGSSKGLLSFTIPVSGTLASGHRLLWIYNIKSNNNNATDTIYFQFGGLVTNPITTNPATTQANSMASFCVTPPANLIIDKQVNQLTAGPGDTLTYSLLFSNTGQTNATGAQVIDTLPTGVTYVGATLNGTAAVPASVSGQDYTFNVNSSDTATTGRVTGGQSGVLEITVTINSPLASGIDTLVNSAVLSSAQTQPVTDSAETTVLRPDVTVTKSANLALVGPGDTVTYTFTIINSGSGPASNVTLSDVLPVQAYYNYVPGSTTLNGAPAADNVSGGTLNFNIGTLNAGSTAVVTLRMAAGAAGVFPATQTNLSNTAAVTDDETSGSRTGNTVTVTVNPLPNLTISKSFSPAGPYAAGDTVTCSIGVSNAGGSDAFGVIVTDNIPVFTSYKTGSLVYNGSSQTDVPGDDTGYFDFAGNRAVFKVGTLASGTTRTMSFQFTVQYPMIAGTSVLTNTARVTAVNAATKSDTITETIQAAPVLSVTKAGPLTSAYPAATVTAAGSGTSVQVNDVSPFIVNQYIRVAAQNSKITAISGNTLTLDSAVTVANGDTVTGSITYSLQYANSGTADALNTILVDTLPAGAIYVESTGSGVYAAGPGTVTWNLGTLPVGNSGLVRVTIFPGAAGNVVNSATITATGAPPATDSFITGVGGLRLTKSTTTPAVPAGGTAAYIIEVTNTSAGTAVDVVVTDILSPGFTYSGTVSISGGTRTSTSDPTVGDQAPSWGTFSIASGATLTITFNAAVAPGIAGTYDNELFATSSNTPVGTFDPLLTTAEDVTVSGIAPPLPSGSLVSSGDISVGCTATLNWTATNATSGTLNPGGISVPVGNGSGSISVTPAATTTYTLALTGPGGTVSYNAAVTVNPAPVITAFSASPTSINAGDPVTFSATFTGGAGVITPGNYAITPGGTYVLPSGPAVSTVYTLTVTAPCGSASQDTAGVTVAVGNGPAGSLVSTGDISVGCTAVLNWTATNATSGTLNPGGISVPVGNGSGSISVTPAATATYTLTLTGPGGTVSYNAVVTVNPAPVITTFSVSPTSINAGDPVTFSAAFTGGTGVITPGNYAITSGSTYVLAAGPAVSTVYTLTVTAPCGPASQAAASVTVTMGNAPTGSLVSRGDISAGCTAILDWTAINATSGTLNPGNIPVPVENGSGGISVKPPTTTTYTLTLTGPGGTTSFTAAVIVHDAPVITSFTATPSRIAAGDPVTFSATFTGGTGVITPGNYPITSGGSYVLEEGPVSTTTYMLTVTASCGSGSRATAKSGVIIIESRLDALKSATDVNGGNLMPGDELLYSIVVKSPNDWDVHGVELVDDIPANTVYVEGSAAGPPGSTVVYTPTTLHYANISVPARGQVMLMFKVTVNNPLDPAVKLISNQGTVSYDKDGDGNNDTQVLTDGDTEVPGEQPTILYITAGPNFNDTVKTFRLVVDHDKDGVISMGDTVRYHITITNSGDLDAAGVEFQDAIPDYTNYVVNSVKSTSGAAAYDSSTNRVQWTGNVAAGESVAITFDVVVQTGIPLNTTIKNQGIVGYDSDDDGVNDKQMLTDGDVSLPGRQPTRFNVGGIFNLPAAKTAVVVNSAIPTPGDELRYEIVLENPTGYMLTGIELVDAIPANTTYVAGSISAPPGAVVVSETPVIRVIDISIAPFSQVLITFNVRIDSTLNPAIDRIVNQGTVNFDADGDGFNDKTTLTDWNPLLPGQQATVTMITCPELEITDTSLEETVKCSGEIEYFIEYTNTSGAAAKNVVIQSVYDFRVTFVSSFPGPDPGTTDTWTIGTVEPGQTGFIRLKVKMRYRLPYLYVVKHMVILTTTCDTRQAGAKTNVFGCGPR